MCSLRHDIMVILYFWIIVLLMMIQKNLEANVMFHYTVSAILV